MKISVISNALSSVGGGRRESCAAARGSTAEGAANWSAKSVFYIYFISIYINIYISLF
jgi:hypothetical protein